MGFAEAEAQLAPGAAPPPPAERPAPAAPAVQRAEPRAVQRAQKGQAGQGHGKGQTQPKQKAVGIVDYLDTKGIKINQGIEGTAVVPITGPRVSQMQVMFDTGQAEARGADIFAELAQVMTKLSGLVGPGQGATGMLTFNAPIPATGGIGFVGLTMSGGLSTAANKGYKASFVGQVQAGANVSGGLFELYAKVFGNVGVEVEGAAGSLPNLLMAAIWNHFAKAMRGVGASGAAAWFEGKRQEASAKAKGGKAKSSRAVGGEMGMSLGREGVDAEANGSINVTVEGSEELEDGKWTSANNVALAVMMRGITGGVKFGAGDKGNTVEVSLMADHSGMQMLGGAAKAGGQLVGAQLAKIAGKARGFDPKSAQQAVTSAAAGVPPSKYSRDAQVKLELKWEQPRGGKWKQAPTAISFVHLQKYGDENKQGLSAAFGIERKLEGAAKPSAPGR